MNRGTILRKEETMKKALLAVGLGLACTFAMAQVPDTGPSFVTEMKLQDSRLGANQIAVLEPMARLAIRGGFVLELHHSEKTLDAARLIEAWLEAHGVREVRLVPDSDQNHSVAIYATQGERCVAAAPRSVAKVPAAAALTSTWSWNEGERISQIVKRWSGKETSIVMDATVRKGGSFPATLSLDEAIVRLARATGCAIQTSAAAASVDCSSAARPAP